MASSGRPTPGSDCGAKLSGVKSGVVTVKPAAPKPPQHPVRH